MMPLFALLVLQVAVQLAEAARLRSPKQRKAEKQAMIRIKRTLVRTQVKQVPSNEFTEDAQAMKAFPMDTMGDPTCRPKCFWTCNKAICDETCEPLCSAPVCQARCPDVNYKDCVETCDEPDCVVVCPQQKCAMAHCPQCKTVCKAPTCKITCPAPQDCESLCAMPLCEWKCKEPEKCPEPQCQMHCNQETSCQINAVSRPLPDPVDKRIMSTANAKLGDSGFF